MSMYLMCIDIGLYEAKVSWKFGSVFRGGRARRPQTRQTGLKQIAWNTQGTVNATILPSLADYL